MRVRVPAGFFIILIILLLSPGTAFAGDFSIRVSDPDQPGQQDYQGSTVNSVLSVPSIRFADNQVMGTLRITGKKGIDVPLSEGNKVMITLPPGSCFMSTPNADNYKHYVKWPAEVDGMKNQICDGAGKPGIEFVSGTRHSLIVAIASLDPSGKTAVIDFEFDEKDFSSIRVTALCEVAGNYANNSDAITRAEFFQRLTEITLPFASSPVKWENSGYTEKQFFDVPANSPYAGNINILSGAGLIKGYPDGTIKPMDNITRIEAGCLLGNLFPHQEYTIDLPDVPNWANGLQTVFSKGIMTGYPDSTFKPDQYLTKSEALIVLQNTLEAY
ncbi:MAG: S-layer homology domain-containing protein [Syntrophomonas sp.]